MDKNQCDECACGIATSLDIVDCHTLCLNSECVLCNHNSCEHFVEKNEASALLEGKEYDEIMDYLWDLEGAGNVSKFLKSNPVDKLKEIFSDIL